MKLKLVLTALMLTLGSQAMAAEVNLYSARKEALIKQLLDDFTQQTGIEVNLVTAKAGELMQRLKSEGKNTPADLMLTVDAGNLYRAQSAGLFQPVDSVALQAAIPAQYREPQGYWYGLSLRARPIMYARDRVDASELGSYEDLADPKWKGRICIRSSSNIYNQSLVASMIVANGEQATEAWAKKFVNNFARSPKGGDTDQIKAVAAGECDIAIANTYYLGRLTTSSKASDNEVAAKIGVIWPNQNGRGVHLNVSGVGLIKSAKNRAEAIRLMEFLVSDAAQKWYADVNNEYPVTPGVAIQGALKTWGAYKADNINLSNLGTHNANAVRLMDRAGWK